MIYIFLTLSFVYSLKHCLQFIMLRLWELHKFKSCASTCVNLVLVIWKRCRQKIWYRRRWTMIELNRSLVCSFNLKLNLTVLTLSCCPTVPVRRDVQENDEEAVRVKEQSILELGTLLAKTGQAAGKMSLCDAHTLPDERNAPCAQFIEISFCNFFLCLFRAWGSAEVCEAFPDLHQQGKGCPTGALSAGPLPRHGGGDGSGGGTVSGVHRVGQGREENLPATSSGGEWAMDQEMLLNKGDNGSDKLPRSSYWSDALSKFFTNTWIKLRLLTVKTKAWRLKQEVSTCCDLYSDRHCVYSHDGDMMWYATLLMDRCFVLKPNEKLVS